MAKKLQPTSSEVVLGLRYWLEEPRREEFLRSLVLGLDAGCLDTLASLVDEIRLTQVPPAQGGEELLGTASAIATAAPTPEATASDQGPSSATPATAAGVASAPAPMPRERTGQAQERSGFSPPSPRYFLRPEVTAKLRAREQERDQLAEA